MSYKPCVELRMIFSRLMQSYFEDWLLGFTGKFPHSRWRHWTNSINPIYGSGTVWTSTAGDGAGVGPCARRQGPVYHSRAVTTQLPSPCVRPAQPEAANLSQHKTHLGLTSEQENVFRLPAVSDLIFDKCFLY